MKKISIFAIAALMVMPAFADVNNDPSTGSGQAVNNNKESEFISDEKTEEGFLTHYLNKAIESSMESTSQKEGVEYGRKVTDYISAPKLGGYFIGKYAYTNQDGKHTGDGFAQRMTRVYVDGTILGDFAYRIQMQLSNSSFHMKDYFVEWKKFQEFKVKIGQYKRAFGLENPYNPWDVGFGDNSQLTNKLTGHNDYIGAEASNNGGRDQGIQIQGDLFPIGKDGHRLLHYQLMVSNGQGINTSDANSQKDITGTLQIQPIAGVFIGFCGWTGNFTSGDVTVGRNRYLFFAKVEKNDWSFRGEYAHSTGHKIADYQSDGTWKGTGHADGWYATIGIPCTKWLKTWVKYDAYRDQATWESTKTIYAIAPNIQLHKNLMFQPEFNYVHDRNLDKADYCEIWLQTYVRF